jgi:serine/threonine-protein kinase
MVIYEMLTGMTAFNAASLTELCAAILERDISPVTQHRLDVPEGLARVVERCLQKDRNLRFQHVGALANALLPFAPKRARICAERAVSVLRAAGMADPELRVLSTIPPPPDPSQRPTDPSGRLVALPAGVPQFPTALAVVEASEAPPPPPPPKRRAAAIIGAGVTVAGLAVVGVLVFLRHGAPTPASHAAAPQTQMVALPAATNDRPTPPPATAEATGATPVPGTATQPVATTTAPPTVAAAAAAQPWLQHGAPKTKAIAPVAPAPTPDAKPAQTTKPSARADEGPDLGY